MLCYYHSQQHDTIFIGTPVILSNCHKPVHNKLFFTVSKMELILLFDQVQLGVNSPKKTFKKVIYFKENNYLLRVST